MNDTCACPGTECDSLSEEAPLPTANDLKEYCIVTSIDSMLRSMVGRLADDSQVEFSSEDLQCQVNFTTQEQMQKIETSVNDYTRKVTSDNHY